MPEPVELNLLPANAVDATAEQDAGTFTAFFAQSEFAEPLDHFTVKPFKAGNASVTSAKARIYSGKDDPDALHVILPTSSGGTTEIVYNSDGSVTVLGDPTAPSGKTYVYNGDGGRNGKLEVVRNRDGWVWGRIKDGDYVTLTDGQRVHRFRGNFIYGWPIDRAAVAASGKATFASTGGADLYLSDGRRIYGGDVDLAVDLANGRMDGAIFRRLVDPDFQLLNAEVTVSNARIAADGSISARDGVTFTTFNDTTTTYPYTDIAVTSSTVDGQFIGSETTPSVIGSYGGTAKTTRSNGGVEDLSFSGIFRGVGQ